MATIFETEPCTRCGGSGRYSYTQGMKGPFGPETCFKCIGTGMQYTKRGAVAKEFYDSLCMAEAQTLVVGDSYWDDTLRRFLRLTDVTTQEMRFHSEAQRLRHVGEEWQTVLHVGSYGYIVGPTTLLRKRQTPGEAEEKQARALAFQATLTKMGKPAKRQAVPA